MTYPLATLGPTITPTGITIPALQDIINSKIATYQSIWGDDVYLATGTQDYQLLAIEAQAIYDSNVAAVAAFNAYSPQTAVGVQLDTAIKINGMAREAGTNSTAICNVVGAPGFTIVNGQAQDTATPPNLWNLPASVLIPSSGTIPVTVTCAAVGAIVAPPNTITTIYTPQLGWDTITNPAASDIGSSTETDGAVRQRQTISTAIPSQTSIGAIMGAVADVPGVVRSLVYENDSATTDSNGIPSHSICAVVQGGDATAIATAILLEKDQGCGTYGTTSETIADPSGLPITINFFELAQVEIYAIVNVTVLPGWVGSTEPLIQAAIVNFINELAIGEDVYDAWLVAEAGLPGTPQQQTFVITSLYIGTAPSPGSSADISIAFNAAAVGLLANVSVVT